MKGRNASSPCKDAAKIAGVSLVLGSRTTRITQFMTAKIDAFHPCAALLRGGELLRCKSAAFFSLAAHSFGSTHEQSRSSSV